MKIQPRRLSSSRGSVLVSTVCLAAIIGVAVACYLTMVGNENFAMQRSQAWNACIAIVEAGIEEAMAHINESGISNLASPDWVVSTNGSYILQRYVNDSFYIVRISASDPPEVTSTGFVPLPLHNDQYLSRTVVCQTKREHMFIKAMVARNTIDLRGNTISTDSFNSKDPTASTDGKYDYAKRRDHGDVATNSSLTNAFNIGNADIAGMVSTGPGGTVKLGANGVVGDLGWIATNTHGLQPGHFTDDMNIILTDAHCPFDAAVPPGSGTISGIHYDYVLGNGNYELAQINNQFIYVEGEASLLVTRAFSMSKGGIYIAPGASLKLYVAAPSASIGGNGVVNMNSDANSFYYFGLPTNTSIRLGGTADLIGVIYAPSADLTLGGGGSGTSSGVFGATVSKTVVMNGNYTFHYDEDLAKSSPIRLYVITTWNEI